MEEVVTSVKRGRPRKYATSALAKQAEREYNKQYYEKHKKDMIKSIIESAKKNPNYKVWKKKYYEKNKDEIKKYLKRYKENKKLYLKDKLYNIVCQEEEKQNV